MQMIPRHRFLLSLLLVAASVIFSPFSLEAAQSDKEIAAVFYHGHHYRHRGWGRVYYYDSPVYYDDDYYDGGPYYYYDDPYYYHHDGVQLRFRIR